MKTHLMSGSRIPAHLFYDDPPEPPAFDLNAVLAHPTTKAAIMDWAEREVASGLKAKNGELLTKLTAYKVGEENGQVTYIDPEAARTAIQFVNTEGKDIPARIQAAVTEATQRATGQVQQLTGQLAEKDTAIQAEVKARHNQMVGYELRDALRDSGIKSGKLPLHEMYLKQFVHVDNDNGREIVVIKGEDGQPRYGKSGLMTLKEFIEEYADREDIADDWQPADQRGGGSGGNGGGNSPYRGGNNRIDQTLPPQERLRLHRAQQAQSRN